MIGIADDGLIVIANRLANQLFSDKHPVTLLGEPASAVIPADMLHYNLSDVHEHAKPYLLNEQDVGYWCRSMGAFSQSSGILLVIAAGLQIELFADKSAV